MKKLGKIKLLAVSVLIMLGMSSCLKNSDPDFAIGANPCFILQEGTNNFRPVMRVYAFESIQSISLKYTPAGELPNQSYMFSAADQTKTQWWLSDIYGSSSSNEIPNGTFTITASNLESQPASLSIPVDIDKKLGELNFKNFAYTVNDGITAELDKVENATDYVLMFKFKDQGDWLFTSISVNSEGAENSPVKVSLTPSKLTSLFGNLEKGTTMTVAIGAAYAKSGSLPLIATSRSGILNITWGEDSTSAE